MTRRLVAFALISVLMAGPAVAQTVVIVRHGEKSAPSGDVELSAAGQARAQALAQTLAGAHVGMVLATPLKRTQQTAAPTARAAGVAIAPITFEGGDAAHAQRVADAARKAPADATVLIVGHSNTVAGIAAALGDPSPTALIDCDYDTMTVIQLDRIAAPKVLRTRYGAPTQAC